MEAEYYGVSGGGCELAISTFIQIGLWHYFVYFFR